jgi:ribose/xylose/arabinose/galactoside ABC-type transport system permease subunit
MSACYFILAAVSFVQGKCFLVCCTVLTAERYVSHTLTNAILFAFLEILGLILALIYTGGSADLLIMTLVMHVIWAGFTLLVTYTNYRIA